MITEAYVEWNGLEGLHRANIDLATFQLKTTMDEVKVKLRKRKFKFFQCFRKVEYLPGGKKVRMPGMVRSESVIHLIVDKANRKEIEAWFERRNTLQDYKRDLLLIVNEHSGGCPIGVRKFKVLGAWPNPVDPENPLDRIVLIHDDIRMEDGKCL